MAHEEVQKLGVLPLCFCRRWPSRQKELKQATALHVFMRRLQPSNVDMILEAITTLVARLGVDPNAIDVYGRTPLLSRRYD